jgi:hypothetical protein
MVSSGMLHHVALVRTDVSEERIASLIRVTRIGELGTALAVTSNRRTLRASGASGSEPGTSGSAAKIVSQEELCLLELISYTVGIFEAVFIL